MIFRAFFIVDAGFGEAMGFMRNLSILLLALTLGACTEPKFAIYLEQKDQDQKGHNESEIASARLVKPALLTENEIEIYDWAQHSITLTPAGEKKLFEYGAGKEGQVGTPLVTRRFIVIANGERCYRGAFWSRILSAGYDYPVIDVYNPTRTIQISQFFEPLQSPPQSDPRADLRVKRALKEARKLKGE